MEQVVVAGAGPTGLWLAAELRLQGVPVTVVEARTEPDPHSKALTIHPRTLEILGMRGIAERFTAEGVALPTGHFGALDTRLDFGALNTPYPYTLALPQVRTESLLQGHASALGADVRRGHRVTGLRQEPHSVSVDVEGPSGPYTVEAQYVVGCDGARSRVREAAGIAFPGTDTTIWGWLADVVLDEPPAAPVSAFEEQGGVMAVPLPGGLTRFVGIAPEDHRPDSPGTLTLEEAREKTTRVLGTDFGMREPHWLSRFGNATRQAAAYRSGRVLLAGDAAHMHFPTGGVGLNVGFQDATNLGWKLAATVRGTAPEGLLDTYHAERHPVGAELLAHTRAQTALMTAYSLEGQALRGLLNSLVAEIPGLSRDLAGRLSALNVSYAPADAADRHPLSGTRAPDLPFADGGSLFALLPGGRHVLLDLTGAETTAAPAPPCGLPPDTLHHHARPRSAGDRWGRWATLRAALIRPDGHVAWAGERHTS